MTTAIYAASPAGPPAHPLYLGCPAETGYAASGYRSVERRADMPPVLQRIFSDTAMPGKFWNNGDVGDSQSGFMSIWHKGGRWILEMERSGFTTRRWTEIYDVSADGQTAQIVPPLGDYCIPGACPCPG